MRIIRHDGSLYLCGDLVLHKCLEVGYQWARKDGFDIYWHFRTRGDHAGLTFNVKLFGLFFEFCVYDQRHWNYDTNAWQKTSEERVAEYEAAKFGHYDE